MYGERDNCTGVSENIILGQMCPLGTGAFDLVLNETALQDAFEVQVRGLGTTAGRGCSSSSSSSSRGAAAGAAGEAAAAGLSLQESEICGRGRLGALLCLHR